MILEHYTFIYFNTIMFFEHTIITKIPHTLSSELFHDDKLTAQNIKMHNTTVIIPLIYYLRMNHSNK